MIKNLLTWGLPALCLVLATGCSKDTDPTPDSPVDPDTNNSAAITFRADLKGLSRATETSFETGDRISLFAVRSQGDETSVNLAHEGNYFQNFLYTYNGDVFTSDPAHYKVDADKLAYFAVYPYAENVADNFTFAINQDQNADSNYTLSDLCTASTGYTDEANPTLSFFHRLSNIVINLEGSNLAGDISVTLKEMPLTVNCDLNNLTFSSEGAEPGDIKCAEYGTNAFRAIIAPHNIPAGKKFAHVVVNDKEYDLASNVDINLASGKQVTLNLRVVNEELVIVTGDIYPWNTEATIEHVIPGEILDKVEDYIDINRGVNPPNVEGCYLIDPLTCVYCEDQGNGGFEPGHIVNSQYANFTDQNTQALTINYAGVTVTGTSYEIGNGAFISGEGNKFSIFFSTEGASLNIPTKTALIISGEKSENGIVNAQYAFVMISKGDDPDNRLMAEGVFRVFKDEDGVAVNAEWPGLPSARPASFNRVANELMLRVK